MNIDKKFKLPILLYDHECSLCLRFKQSLEKLNEAEFIQKVSIHDNDIYKAFPILNKEDCQEAMHLIDQDSNIHVGPDALSWLIKEIPCVSKFAWLAESEAGKKGLDFFYKMAQKYRSSLLNRCPTCKNKQLNR